MLQLCFVRFDSLHTSQQLFSYVGMGLPGLNQYSARINVSCSRTQHNDAVEAGTRNPLGLLPTTPTLSYFAPCVIIVWYI